MKNRIRSALCFRRSDSTGVAKFVWDQENVIEETDDADVSQVVYTLEPLTYGNLISQKRGANTSYHLFDALGSTDRLTNSGGTETDSYVYEGFGGVKASSGSTTNPYRFVGQQGYYDDPDLVEQYVRARPYDPVLARWLATDPVPTEHNQYAYVANTPVNGVDASGAQFGITPLLPPPSIIDLPVGGHFPSRVRALDCAKARADQIAQALRGACDCVEKAYDLVTSFEDELRTFAKSEGQVLRDYWVTLFKPTRRFRESNFTKFRRMVGEVWRGCTDKTTTFCVWCIPGTRGRCGPDRATPYAYARSGGPIFVCDKFFSDLDDADRPFYMWHEFGRVYLWKELPHEADDPKTTSEITNVGIWRYLIKELCKSYPAIRKAAKKS